MEGSDRASQALQEFGVDLAALKAFFERRVLGQPLHFHGPFDDLATAVNLQPGRGARERHDAKINPRGKSAVEANLFLTEVMALFKSAEIQKPEIDRFFDLVGIRASQEDNRDVSLTNLHLLDWMRVRRSVRKCLNDFGQFH